jgi:hypothetical protein
MNNNFKHSIDNWTNSSVYKKFKAQLNKRKLALFIMDTQTLTKLMESKIYFTTKELEQTVDTILQMSTEDLSQAEFIVEAKINQFTKEELYFGFTKNLITWYFYLDNNLKKEYYELAAKLRDVISLEIAEFRNNISLHYDFIEAEEEPHIQEINNTIKDYFNICS